MTKSPTFAARFAGIATLALAALPIAALATGAHARPAPAHVQIADLDFNSRSGWAAFDARVHQAGAQMCRDERSLMGQSACQRGVRAEAHEKLAQVLNTRSALTVVASR